jgi:hypothetical protein
MALCVIDRTAPAIQSSRELPLLAVAIDSSISAVVSRAAWAQ